MANMKLMKDAADRKVDTKSADLKKAQLEVKALKGDISRYKEASNMIDKGEYAQFYANFNYDKALDDIKNLLAKQAKAQKEYEVRPFIVKKLIKNFLRRPFLIRKIERRCSRRRRRR